MAEVCFISDKSLLKGKTVIVERGLDTLRQSSVERKDGKDEYLQNASSIEIHVHCHKEYKIHQKDIEMMPAHRHLQVHLTAKCG